MILATMAMVPVPGIAPHGIGGRQDLPVPLGISVGAAVLVVIVSFVALAVLWREPRWQTEEPGPVFAQGLVRVLRPVMGTLGLVALLLVVVAGFAGVDNSSRNPGPVLVFVVFWLIVPFVAALFGDLYPFVDPWRRLAGFVAVDDTAPGESSQERDQGGFVERFGYLPATGAFLLFTWFELVSPATGPAAVSIAAVVYTASLLLIAAWVGPSAMTTSGDAFAVYNRFLGGIGPYRVGTDGLRRRGWLRGLVSIPERRGIDTFVVAMIATVTYDGASVTPWWRDTLQRPLESALIDAGLTASPSSALTGTVYWVLVFAAVYAAYLAASAAAARLADAQTGVRHVARRFAHTLVPIGFAYAFAHYFTLILFEGQLVLSTISDPFGRGWDLFGTAGRRIDYSLISESTSWVWYVQLTAIVFGHVAGVLLAHDRALADFESERAVASQYAMLGLMVVLTGLGIVILAAG